MVSQVINVIVNSKGAVTVQKQLSAIGDSAKTTTSYLNSFRAILASAMTFSGLGAITRTVDDFTQLQNRLRLVTSEAEGVGNAWNRLVDIANGSYSSIDNTVNLYYRVAQAFQSWGEKAEDAYEFVDKFQKAAILSGSTMQTTSQAVYQFSQALNKGKLDGDEFRSVLEGLPYVANIIQKSLGKTRAELYEMSKDGKITVDRIKQAFEEAAKTINSDWGKITPTIGMAIMVLKNNWMDFVGEIQNSTGVFSLAARVILVIADNFNLLAIAMTPVAITMAFMAGKLGLGLLIMGFKDMIKFITPAIALMRVFNATLMANPLTIIPTLIAGAIAAIIFFRNELGITNEFLLKVWETIKLVFTSFIGLFEPIVTGIANVVVGFGQWLASFEMIRAIISVTGQDISDFFSSVMAHIGSVFSYFSNLLGPVFSLLGELITETLGLLKELDSFMRGHLLKSIETMYPTFKKVWDFIQPALKVFIQLVRDVFEGWKIISDFLVKNFWPTAKDIFEGWVEIIKFVIDSIKSLISFLRTALQLMSQVGSGGGGGGGGPGLNYGGQFYAGEFANGGGFKVPGTGSGRDTTPVSFRANRGERVTVETKKQQRTNDAAQSVASPDVNVPVEIKNIIDPSGMVDALDTDTGHKQLVNVIKYNREELRAVLGVN